MKMVHNLIIILLIIGFSFLFETSCNYEFNSQLTFILLSLFVVVIYKFLINKCIMKENFSSFDDQINSFLKQGLPEQNTSRADMENYSKQLTQLQDNLAALNNLKFSKDELKIIDKKAKEGKINLWAPSIISLLITEPPFIELG